MRSAKRLGVVLLGSALALGQAACGNHDNLTGNGGPSPSPSSTPVASCTQTVIDSGGGSAKTKTLYYKDFSFPDVGRLDMTVDWTFATSPIGVYVVPANTCTLDQFNARNCNFLLQSEPSSAKPRKVSVSNLAAGNYRWIIANFSANDESFSYQVVITKGICPASAGAPPSVAARPTGSIVPIERATPR